MGLLFGMIRAEGNFHPTHALADLATYNANGKRTDKKNPEEINKILKLSGYLIHNWLPPQDRNRARDKYQRANKQKNRQNHAQR